MMPWDTAQAKQFKIGYLVGLHWAAAFWEQMPGTGDGRGQCLPSTPSKIGGRSPDESSPEFVFRKRRT